MKFCFCPGCVWRKVVPLVDTMSSLLVRVQELQGRLLRQQRAGILSAACAILLGFLFLCPLKLGEGMKNLSYDFPFMVRALLPFLETPVPTNEVVVIYMDDRSHRELNEEPLRPWDRAKHARLIDQLTAAGAQAVVFDILFDKEQLPGDVLLARAAGAHGHVFVGAEIEARDQGNVTGDSVVPPTPALRSSTTWGLVEHSSPDRMIRRHFQGRADAQSPLLTWKLVQLTKPLPEAQQFAVRWVNYYGPPLALPHFSFVDVLSNNVPSVVFSNKVVFVGAWSQIPYTGGGGAGTDDFRTPYSVWWDNLRSPGVEILATTYLNLYRRDWLTEPGWFSEVLLLLAAGLALGFGLVPLRPVTAIWVALGGILFLAMFACVECWLFRLWFPWGIVAFVQVPVTLAWSLSVNVTQLRRENELLEKKLATAVGERPTRLPIPEKPTVAASAPVAAMAPAPGAPPIPNHEMLRCIGKGAYGEVWLARDEIGSYHAVKVVYRSSFHDSGPFDREFRGIQQYTPISRTHHGLVHILHVGRNKEAAYFFYIMELGDCEANGTTVIPETYCAKNLGRELDRRGKLPVKECVHLAMELAEALHYLHSKQLIHRDIKPSNIIFVNGLPKFADVGLVTHVAERGRDVTYLGTEGFIAPEGPGTPAADVFSLGKVIYEACMGHSAAQYPELPTALTQHEELDEMLLLNEIILKACDPDLRRRYKSAVELQGDLMRLNDRLYGGAQRER